MQDMRTVQFVTVQVKSPLVSLTPGQDVFRAMVRKWCRAMGKRGIVVMAKVRIVTAAAPSLKTYLENTQRYSKMQPYELK